LVLAWTRFGRAPRSAGPSLSRWTEVGSPGRRRIWDSTENKKCKLFRWKTSSLRLLAMRNLLLKNRIYLSAKILRLGRSFKIIWTDCAQLCTS
jgi:hypothetical protein